MCRRSSTPRAARGPVAILLLFCASGLSLACAGTPSPPTPSSSAVGEFEVAEAPIPALQGAGHVSPFEGQRASTRGVVTAVDPGRGFYLQDPRGDGDVRTSDAIFVYTGDPGAEGGTESRARTPGAGVEPGQRVRVRGRVLEVEVREGELSTTCLRLESLEVEEPTVGALPEPVVFGPGGRRPPSGTIDDDALSAFEPESDAIDFFETLESMRVAVPRSRVAGPTSRHGDFAVMAEPGSPAGRQTPRGAALRRSGDGNTEVLIIGSALESLPRVDVGDVFRGPIQGVLAYAFGRYRLEATGALPEIVRLEARPTETGTALRSAPGALTVASFNVLNLNAGDDEAKFRRLAEIIVRDLGEPDILALQEVQDDNGRIDDGTVSADETLGRLTRTILAAGGPAYAWHQLDPVDKADGGAPGSNIRVAFLVRPERVEVDSRLAPVDLRPESPGEPRVELLGGRPLLVPNPARILDPAFDAVPEERVGGTRKPLVLQARFAGEDLFLVGLHLTSRRRDDWSMGSTQPPVLHSQPRREAQARAVRRTLDHIRQRAPEATVVVLGDLNEFPWNPPVRILRGDDFENLAEQMPEAERYTFNFQGVSQLLDHVLVTRPAARGAEVDIVHTCSDLAHGKAVSDHDPIVVRLALGNQ